ncbi:hypothetical protein A1Q1_02728 [Trichosporon asahii var. asahii CBS 2479]|uniref:DUF1014-domain-containing protein n=1 Tax=Trichosporon asahii var. asahii (strain ATCC 90039 / CBS 2479 / JCM 2466 / KCTC 7840 / NBRC 103889/ NCYC 2677 / UAMH 7654) TaxID=1186058 RepID=J4UBK4_TRIAS|nr:hypothetical protein A1Q1_02728 [Trichosporon asahii var. asahii CBS 2479]EJT48260.1 hypothetical protein A1Q1_02728 [Trichosporon asahii var. asahii CBS 2479]
MAPKGGNAKKESGRAKKAENEAKKAEAAAAQKEKAEADKWKSGAKGASKADLAAAKQAEAAAKKAEREALLAAEEASMPTKKAAPKAGQKKKPSSSAGGFAKTNAGVSAFRTDDPQGLRRDPEREVQSLSAVGVDEMLEALEIVNEKTDKSSQGTKAAGIDTHPERRVKAAFNAYLERELPKYKEEYPGLRQNQYRDRLWAQFQKSSENPMNQLHLKYNATKEEKLAVYQETARAREQKYASRDD